MVRELSDLDLYLIDKAVETAAHYAQQYPSGTVSPPPEDGTAIHVSYKDGLVGPIVLEDAPNHGLRDEIK